MLSYLRVSEAILVEVRDFLQSLRRDLPVLFRPAPPRRRAARARAGQAAQREAARALFTARCAHFAALMGLSYNRVFIKDQSSVWGSCSEKLNLNFNWRVAFAAPEVADYLVVHELAHIPHRGHGREFWKLVARFCPDWKRHRRWLKDNAEALRRL